MRINFAHLQDQGIHFAVFDADATSRTPNARADVLADLTQAARAQGYRVEKSALAFSECGRLTFYGTPDLVDYLCDGWVPHWTHWIETN